MNLLVDESLVSYAKPTAYLNFKIAKHNPKDMPTFEIFDRVNPNIYIADADLLNETVFKNIEERPAMRVAIIQRNTNIQNHPNFKKLTDRLGDVYPWIINDGHADLLDYRGSEKSTLLKSDVVSIEDTPIAGIENLQFPSNVVFKVFSSMLVSSNYFCGFIPPEIRKNAYKSAKVSISQGNNIYNSILCDCLPVQVDSDILTIVNLDNQQKIKELKAIVHNSKNNFIDMAHILKHFGMDKESNIVLEKMKELL